MPYKDPDARRRASRLSMRRRRLRMSGSPAAEAAKWADAERKRRERADRVLVRIAEDLDEAGRWLREFAAAHPGRYSRVAKRYPTHTEAYLDRNVREREEALPESA